MEVAGRVGRGPARGGPNPNPYPNPNPNPNPYPIPNPNPNPHKVLRYAASVDPATSSLTVGLKEVPASSPLGTLSGSDNLVEIYSR